MGLFERCAENPIVVPGKYEWRRCVTLNPGVIRDDDGTFYMLERTGGSLRPFPHVFGLLKSDDGVHFEHVCDEPVFTAGQLGFPHGSVQDPRLTRIDGQFQAVYAMRRYAVDCSPTGTGVPEYDMPDYPGMPADESHASRSGIAVSDDMIHWRHVAYVGPEDVDDRDNILFPEKVGGRYAMLRRPAVVDLRGKSSSTAGVRISFSDDLTTWTDSQPVADPEQPWEGAKIGGSAPPLRTDEGWLVTYHGVDAGGTYRTGLMLLDLHDPTRVLARTHAPVLEPEAYYERFGLVIPNVIFATANVVVEGVVHLYYGCCDTTIALATCPLADLLSAVRSG